jgi:hypothetical protein
VVATRVALVVVGALVIVTATRVALMVGVFDAAFDDAALDDAVLDDAVFDDGVFDDAVATIGVVPVAGSHGERRGARDATLPHAGAPDGI